MQAIWIRTTEALVRWRRERGATGVEYGIMLAAVAAVIILVAYAVGGKASGAFNSVNSQLP